MDTSDGGQEGKRAANRLASLDVFRGTTVAGMILVNNPGTWEAIHPPLAHAAWHGWTPTNLIFPFFLFIVGVSIPLAFPPPPDAGPGWPPTNLIFPFFLFIVGVSITLAFARRVEAGGTKRDLYLKGLRRTVLIYAFGFLLAGFPYFNLSTIRLTGV